MYTEPVKPKKTHYNRFMGKVNGYWIFDKSEPVCGVLKSTYETAKSVAETGEKLKPWYPTELAVAYGLRTGLIELVKSDTGYYNVMLTDKGLADVIKKQKTTCAFTGRRVRRGEF